MRTIAITSMAGVFPGACNIEEYWQNILSAKVAPLLSLEERWGVSKEQYFDPTPGKPNKIYLDKAFCLPEEVSNYSVSEFERQIGIGKKVVSDLLKGINMPSSDKIGLVAGTSWSDQSYFNKDIEYMYGNIFGREEKANYIDGVYSPDEQLRAIADANGIEGPRLAVDTACASSIYALDIGVGLIESGQVDCAVILGLNAFMPAFLFAGFSKLRALSAKEEILPFSVHASGMVPGECVGAILIEPLEVALSKGHKVLGVVKSLGLSADGSERSVFAPGPEGQLLAFRRTYENISHNEIDYIEAHGTATPVGDETELTVLNQVFEKHLPQGKKIPVGSVKSLIGHTLAAAGIASIIKSLLMLREGVIPPHIKVEKNATIHKTCFTLTEEATSWPVVDRPKRIGIDSFGFSGANAHLVIESYNEKDYININKSEKDEEPSAKMRFSPIAIVDFESAFGKSIGAEKWSEKLVSDKDSFVEFPYNRFNFIGSAEEYKDSKIIGSFLPSKFTIDATGFRMGLNLIKRIDQFQVLGTHLTNVLTSRNVGIKESDDTSVAFLSNMGGEMSLRTARKFSLMHNDKIKNDENKYSIFKDMIETEASFEEIASSLPAMFSGYPASCFNVRGFHQMLSGENGMFWTNLAMTPYYLNKRCKNILLGAGHVVKSPLDLLKHIGNAGEKVPLGEGLGVFLIKSLENAMSDNNKILAVINKIVPAQIANTYEEACKVAGIDPDSVDIREKSQIDPKFVNSEMDDNFAQKITGYLGEATGIESLAKIMLKDGKIATIEVYNGSCLLMTLFLDKRDKFEGKVNDAKMPLDIVYYEEILEDKKEELIKKEEQQESVYLKEKSLDNASDILESLIVWQKVTADSVHDYFNAQRMSLRLIKNTNEQERKPIKIPPLSERLENIRRNKDNVVLSSVNYLEDRKVYVGDLIVVEGHPYFFDHPLDHVPGILLFEGVLQLVEIAAPDVLNLMEGQELFIRSIDLRFKKYCEKNVPVKIEIEIKKKNNDNSLWFEASVKQNEEVVCETSVEVQSVSLDYQKMELKFDNNNQATLNANAKTTHKQYEENVMTAKVEKIREGCFECGFLTPPEGHVIEDGNSSFRSMIYLLETTRQFLMQVAHEMSGIPLGLSMVLINVNISVDRPAYKNVPLRIRGEKQPVTKVGNLIIANLKSSLYDADGYIGGSTFKIQVTNEETYESQRWSNTEKTI